ncbi:MAG: hypothetical protein AABZ61_02590, partial [Bacteroidota bacterium]
INHYADESHSHFYSSRYLPVSGSEFGFDVKRMRASFQKLPETGKIFVVCPAVILAYWFKSSRSRTNLTRNRHVRLGCPKQLGIRKRQAVVF